MKNNNIKNEAFRRGMDEFVNNNFSESVEAFTKVIELILTSDWRMSVEEPR